MKNEIEKRSGSNSIAVINKQEFVKTFEPLTMLTKFNHVKTPAQAIAEDNNGVSFYAKHLGQDTILAVIELHLVALNESVNVGQPLTKYQIKEIAIEIFSNFYFLSMVEINLVFRRAKLGQFGKLYGVLNIVDVLSWFNEYSEERVQHFINDSTKHRHNDHSMRSQERKDLERHNKIMKEAKK